MLSYLKIFLLLLIVSFFGQANAQLSVGIRGGVSAHGLYLLPTAIEKYQTAYTRYNGGLQVIYNNENNAGIVLEINYAEKGWQEEDTSVVGSYFRKDINYLEIPVYSRWEAGKGKLRGVITIGPYLGIKLNEKTDSANFSHLWNELNPYNQYEQTIRDIHYGFKAGLGLKYKFTKKASIFFDVRYDIQIAGSRDIFIDRPNGIDASRLKEIGASFGITWDLIPQKQKSETQEYVPKGYLNEEY